MWSRSPTMEGCHEVPGLSERYKAGTQHLKINTIRVLSTINQKVVNTVIFR